MKPDLFDCAVIIGLILIVLGAGILLELRDIHSTLASRPQQVTYQYITTEKRAIPTAARVAFESYSTQR